MKVWPFPGVFAGRDEDVRVLGHVEMQKCGPERNGCCRARCHLSPVTPVAPARRPRPRPPPRPPPPNNHSLASAERVPQHTTQHTAHSTAQHSTARMTWSLAVHHGTMLYLLTPPSLGMRIPIPINRYPYRAMVSRYLHNSTRLHQIL